MYIKKILWTIAIVGLVIFGCIAYYIYGAMFKPNTSFNQEKVYIFIPSNATYKNVRQQLIPLLDDINSFDALAKQKIYTTNIIAGKFAITKGMNNNDIINSIRSKNIPVKVIFNNQNSLEDLAGRISKQIEADSISLLNSMLDSNFLSNKGFTVATALGMYLPDSYEFFWNTSAKTFRDKMYKRYINFWTDARKLKAESYNLTPNEVMILAAIVHQESKQADEQPRIAGVYLNRLRIGMKLDADPTIKYAAYQLPKYKNTIIRRVLNVHKTIKSPYNTYNNVGLPPGLIAMPDLSAVKAVLNAETHNYLYFVANKEKTGYHKFAKTLAQHNVNARQYQQYLSSLGINK